MDYIIAIIDQGSSDCIGKGAMLTRELYRITS